MDERKLIEIYVDILKNDANYTGKEISTLSEEYGFKFSEGTLVKSYKKKGKTQEYYDVSSITIKGITNVLKKLLKYEEERNPKVQNQIEKNKFDFSKIPLVFPQKDEHNEDNILISWEKSQQYEINAELVFGITPTLNWARSQTESLIENAKKGFSYYYILTEQRGIINKTIIEEKILKAGVADKIQIKELYKLPEFSNFNSITIPIPYDIAIYVNTHPPGHHTEKLTLAVTSIVVVNPQTINDKRNIEHQDVIINKQRTEELLFWAESTWEKLKKI